MLHTRAPPPPPASPRLASSRRAAPRVAGMSRADAFILAVGNGKSVTDAIKDMNRHIDCCLLMAALIVVTAVVNAALITW